MSEYIRLSTILNESDTKLKINNTTDISSYDILQFQPSQVLNYSAETGIYCNEDGYKEKVLSFLSLAKEKNSALVITPEASVPYDIIGGLVNDSDMWPEDQNLWCLCAEGISISDFKTLVSEMKSKDNIELIIEDNITYKQHINALWYIFKDSNNNLCVVVQLKQMPMSDRTLSGEGADLSLGSKVYIIDLNGKSATRNTLISLICADAIQLSSSEVLTSLIHTHPIIINPQLNGVPFSKKFITFRNSFFTDSNLTKQRMITSNWGAGTKINDLNPLKESGSSYYNYLSVNGKHHIKAISQDKDLFKHRGECQKNGVWHFCDAEYNIWNFGNDEHVMHYYIKKEEVFNSNPSLGIQLDPLVKGSYYYDSEANCWVIENIKKCLSSNMGTIFSDLVPNETEYLPFNYQNCTNGICTEDCLWIYNDFFFGLCFSNLVRGELETNNEVSNRTSVALNSSSLKNTKDKRKLFLKLVKLLKNNEFPKALVMYENNHKFDIDTDAALTGSNNIYNLSIQHENSDFPSWKYKKGLVIILDTDEIFEVETVYNRMRKKIKEDYSDQILIYYRDDSGYICYDEPFNNVSIGKGNSSFTSKTSSYYEGGMNYE